MSGVVRMRNGEAVVLPPYPTELAEPAAHAFESCYVCGVRRGRHDDPDTWVVGERELHPSGPTTWADAEEGGRQELYLEQPWRDRHRDCDPSDRGLVLAVVGVELDDDDAAELHRDGGVALAAVEANRTGRTPFSWISAKDVEALRVAAVRMLHRDDPRGYVGGRCAVCGASKSTRWVRLRGEWTWHDGARPAVCGECADSVSGADPFDADEIRCRALSRAANMRFSRMTMPTARKFKVAIEHLTAEQQHEAGHRSWDYAPEAVGQLSRLAATRNPSLVIDERARTFATARALLAERRAAAEAEQKQAESDPLARLW